MIVFADVGGGGPLGTGGGLCPRHRGVRTGGSERRVKGGGARGVRGVLGGVCVVVGVIVFADLGVRRTSRHRRRILTAL